MASGILGSVFGYRQKCPRAYTSWACVFFNMAHVPLCFIESHTIDRNSFLCSRCFSYIRMRRSLFEYGWCQCHTCRKNSKAAAVLTSSSQGAKGQHPLIQLSAHYQEDFSRNGSQKESRYPIQNLMSYHYNRKGPFLICIVPKPESS